MTFFLWVGFITFVLLMLALDLGVFHREPRVIRVREALAWSALWIALAIAFNVAIFFIYEHSWEALGLPEVHRLGGHRAAVQFFTAYVIEKSLSLDNIFVIALVFSYFAVPLAYQHRVLFWGVLGALVLRGIMIGAGSVMIARFSWTTYLFGAVLILTAVKMLLDRHDNLEPERNPLVRGARRFFPVTSGFREDRFVVRESGAWMATPLLLVLLVVESSDVLFAIDSIPAVFAITQEPFLVFTSNVFAVLGLRSLYFALAPLLGRFRYLKMSLVFILAFVGVKMLLIHHAPIPTTTCLLVIVGILSVGVFASVWAPHRDTAPLVSPVVDQIEDLKRVTVRGARRIVVLVLGTSVILLGVAMIVLPGPAIVVVPLGLAVLGTEFVWARRLLRRLRAAATSLNREPRGRG